MDDWALIPPFTVRNSDRNRKGNKRWHWHRHRHRHSCFVQSKGGSNAVKKKKKRTQLKRVRVSVHKVACADFNSKNVMISSFVSMNEWMGAKSVHFVFVHIWRRLGLDHSFSLYLTLSHVTTRLWHSHLKIVKYTLYF